MLFIPDRLICRSCQTLALRCLTLTPRWVPFNGGLGRRQSLWLERTLEEAKQRDDRVIVFSHIPVYVEVSARLICMLCTEATQVLVMTHSQAALDIIML